MEKEKALEALADLDVFVVDIKMQKNATWQGSLRRMGEDQSQNFRSALEMLKLMDTVMDTADGEPSPGWAT